MTLYKYMRADYALEFIRTGMIKVSTLEDVNDPDEFMPNFILTLPDSRRTSALSLPDAKEQFKRGWCSAHGFISLSATWDNNAMWGIYGDRLRGMVLQFEVAPESQVFPVKYNNSRPNFTEHACRNLDDEKGRCFYGQKGLAWQHEQEWRILVGYRDWVVKTLPNGKEIFFKKLDSLMMLRGVLLGSYCSKTIRDVRMALEEMGTTNQTEIITLCSAFDTYAIQAGLCERFENGQWHTVNSPNPM